MVTTMTEQRGAAHGERAQVGAQENSPITAFAGRHEGEAVVVCGCGRSLGLIKRPQPWVTIGVNDVGRAFDPTYLVVVNPLADFPIERAEYVRRSRARFVFSQLALEGLSAPLVRFALGRFGGTVVEADGVFHYTANSPYVAVNLAAYMGAARIGLIGVDFVDGHFFGDTGPHTLSGSVARVDGEYAELRRALRERGIDLVNLSPVSRIASLPRVEIGTF